MHKSNSNSMSQTLACRNNIHLFHFVARHWSIPSRVIWAIFLPLFPSRFSHSSLIEQYECLRSCYYLSYGLFWSSSPSHCTLWVARYHHCPLFSPPRTHWLQSVFQTFLRYPAMTMVGASLENSTVPNVLLDLLQRPQRHIQWSNR